MFYPDLEENSSRGIKSRAISKYQGNVGLYPAAFTLWLIILTKLLIIFLIANLPWQRHPFAERSGAKDIVDSGTGFVRSDYFFASQSKFNVYHFSINRLIISYSCD